jgi:hypothetical protein
MRIIVGPKNPARIKRGLGVSMTRKATAPKMRPGPRGPRHKNQNFCVFPRYHLATSDAASICTL